ncbi:LOW QUALITY PROTEIN: reverse transcriptase [Phytophthora palmivora]|uniref:Reverse transcriptase n=1 Tax=Phytophthora palmivora TaxID=4796 RepID=A0A2P4X345_9STRA|nr:LOW QUALITY PROTEIN: reverse transcriptase [Phytophthora palmivora]
MKRDWNQSADSLASAALRRESGVVIVTEEERQDLMTLNRLDELLIAKDDAATVKIAAVTRSRKKCRPQVLQEEIVQRMRMERISRAQDEEKWIIDLKAYLRGDVRELTSAEAKSCSKIADRYETDESGLLFYFPPTKQFDEDRDLMAKLVVPETLQNDLMHHYHSSLEGGHHGIGRTYHKIRAHFHWRGLYQSVQRYVGQCIDCEAGKGRPMIHGEYPGNLQATYPFQIVGVDLIPLLPSSYKGNTELLIWIDLFTGYMIAKTSASRTAQTAAENYEERVFHRFGASEAIRHDRESGFMSDFFRSFNKIVGQRQRATMAYHPQIVNPVGGDIVSRSSISKLVSRLTRDYVMRSKKGQIDTMKRSDHMRSKLELKCGYRVKEGYACKLAHMWHDPFRVLELVDEHAVRLEIAGTEYRLFPVVHVSNIKRVRQSPDRPQMRLTTLDQDRYDFDEALLPQDSWIRDLDKDEYEVEKIVDMRSGRRTRYGRTLREFLVQWKGYDEPTWVNEADLNCGALLYDYLRDRTNRNQFEVMQSHEEP